MRKKSVRAVAALALAKVLGEGKSLAHVLPLHTPMLADKDRALLQELCFGVCRYAQRFERLSRKLLSKPLKARDQDVQALLYLGIYQLQYTRIPDHAAIGETVQAAKELRKAWATSLLNGVLRNFQRSQEQLATDNQNDPVYRFSHPNWLLNRFNTDWPEHWQALTEANNRPPPLTLRVNQRKTDRSQYLQRLKDADIAAQATDYSDCGVQLTQAVAIDRLPEFANGWASVQDEAAQLAPTLLDLAPGQRVLDACCAPGGKTCHILESAPELDELVALDADAVRMQRVQQNLDRLGLQATLKVADASAVDQWWDQRPFDRILLDAPCSATGVIRRHPDIKLLRRAEDIDQLAVLQQRLLTALWPTLKVGGRIVYATCSVLKAENEQIVEQFVRHTKDAHSLAISASWGLERPYGRQLLPQADGPDGFYYAILEKQAPSPP